MTKRQQEDDWTEQPTSAGGHGGYEASTSDPYVRSQVFSSKSRGSVIKGRRGGRDLRGQPNRERGGYRGHSNLAMRGDHDGKLIRDADNCKSYFECIDNKCSSSRNDLIVKFIADSGTTEHLSKSSLIFKTLNTGTNDKIKCASKDGFLTTHGVGDVKIKTNNGKDLILRDVLYSEDLSENLLSLKQFVDKGLKIYLDNKIIDIYNPNSNESLISGIYKEPFWQIQLKIASDNNKTVEKHKYFAFMGHKYNTRNNKSYVSEASVNDEGPIRERGKDLKNTNCEILNLTDNNKNEIVDNGLRSQDTRFELRGFT